MAIDMFSYPDITEDSIISEYENKYGINREYFANKDVKYFKAKDIYYPQNLFSPYDMIEKLRILFEDEKNNKNRCIRTVADMSWAINKIKGIDSLILYESLVNNFIRDKRWMSICMYNINIFSGKMIIEILRTHPYTICGGVLVENPYYVDPDKFDNTDDINKVE